MRHALTVLFLLLLGSAVQASQPTQSHQLTCGEFVAATGNGSSPRWQLTGNIRPVHRDTPRLRGRFMIIEGCMGVLLDMNTYDRLFLDRFRTKPLGEDFRGTFFVPSVSPES